jgi:hypothetical protein
MQTELARFPAGHPLISTSDSVSLFQSEAKLVTYQTTTLRQEVTAADIDTMAKMSIEDYREYIRHNLIYLDHHEILRSMAAGYPLAVTKEQAKTLVDYLAELAPSVGAE